MGAERAAQDEPSAAGEATLLLSSDLWLRLDR